MWTNSFLAATLLALQVTALPSGSDVLRKRQIPAQFIDIVNSITNRKFNAS
jgi:hypothetical protein